MCICNFNAYVIVLALRHVWDGLLIA